jgi:hypothetical protein
LRADCNRRAIDAIEVRLILLVELDRTFSVENVAALDEDGALIRTRLAFVELVARTGWWCRLRRRRERGR